MYFREQTNTEKYDSCKWQSAIYHTECEVLFICFIFIINWIHVCLCAQSLQSCLTLCNPTDCSPPGSLSMGFFQARILEWVVMPSSRGSSQPRDQTPICLHFLHCRQILSLPIELPGKPEYNICLRKKQCFSGKLHCLDPALTIMDYLILILWELSYSSLNCR